jgi:polyribonucleotide nucleotidyltransferase
MARRMIEEITSEAEPGRVYKGKVKDIKPFGAFVEILPGKDGLVHISEIADQRVERVEDVLHVGDEVSVLCLGVDPKGKVKLSIKALGGIQAPATAE